MPTIFHLTHYKAGSNWVHIVLNRCRRDLVVDPEPDRSQILEREIEPGRVYPKLYLTKAEFDELELPEDSRRFLVIRDLRDTLVSAYFSMLRTHDEGEMHPDAKPFRGKLRKLSAEEGLLKTMDGWLPSSAGDIQESWLAAGEPFVRYEDLLTNDVELFERTLIDICHLPAGREELRVAVESARFSNFTGRSPGEEDSGAHERKGISGDWRNHFTDRVSEEFKARWGHVLIASGYEPDLDW